MNFFDKDVFINVAGGVSVSEPAVDLGIAVGAASSSLDRAVDPYMVFVGEVSPTPASRSRTWPSCAMGEVFYKHHQTRRNVPRRETHCRSRWKPVGSRERSGDNRRVWIRDGRKEINVVVRCELVERPPPSKKNEEVPTPSALNWPTYLSFG